MSFTKKIINHISPYMAQKGYALSNKCFYIIQDEIAYCIEFDVPGGLLYVTFYVMPLYIPCENRYYTYGNRLNCMPEVNLSTLKKDANNHDIAIWCQSLISALEKVVFPFFCQIASSKKLIKFVKNKNDIVSKYFCCPELQLYRLQVFVCLHLHEKTDFKKIIKQYRSVLQSSTFLTDMIKTKYLQELNLVETLINQSDADTISFCNAIVLESVKKCF